MAVAARAMEDRPELGIFMMLIAWFLFSVVDTSAKWLVIAAYPAFQITFMRYAGHFVISLFLIARGGMTRDRFQTGHVGLVTARALLLISATLSNFIALNYLPLTVTSAIMFSSPILVCLISVSVLGERVGPWRIFAILLGFIGVLIVIRPVGSAFHPAMFLALYNAFSLACYSILTRKLAGIVATDTQQFYMGALGTGLMLPFAIWTWRMPDNALDWALLVGVGVFAWAGHQLLTNAHRFGSAATLMPYTYSFMIYLAILGFFVFDHVPDKWTIIGALVIVLSGLIIWKRERK
jgi:drug/metabolite transporter (DMT)-like permease